MAIITTEEDCKYYMYRISLKEDPSKGYVGVTNDYKRRWKEHHYDARHGDGYYIANALAKYGIDAFDWKVIAIFRNGKIAGEMEQIAKQFLGLGHYNLTDGGEGALKPAPETLKKRGDAVRKTMEDPERREARSEALKAFHLENPEAAEKKAEHLRTISRDPEMAARRATSLKETVNKPEYKIMKKALMKEVLSAPEVRAKMSLSQAKRYENPAQREQQSQMFTDYWAVPENYDKHCAIIKERTNRPEVKAKVAAESKARWSKVKELGLRNLKELSEYELTHETKAKE